MKCDELRERLQDLLDGALDEASAAECRAHLGECGGCAREKSSHERTWAALGAIDEGVEALPRARLLEIAGAALAAARAEPADGAPDEPPPGRPASQRPRPLATRAGRIAVAAALVLALTLGARLLFFRDSGAPPDERPPVTSDPPPEFLDDPDFVRNFEVIFDLPELSSDGELLDLDDEVLVVQALKES